jgi:hypothetical protein
MKRTIVWQRKSRYALVTCFSNGRGVVVEKEIAPENVNSGNAHWVNDTSVYFRNKLRDLGVLLAEPYTFTVRGSKAIQRSPYVGLNLDEVFHKGDASAKTLQELFSTMRGVLTQEEREVGLDARLSNFCLGPDKRVYYVDTFPPLVKYKEKFIVHFPNPTDSEVVEQELKRKFDPLGILRRIRFSILAQDAGINEQHILVAVRDVMGKVFGHQVQDFFQTLPDNKPEQALAELNLSDPDAIRELALRFMPVKGKAREKYFSTVFDLSSNFCPLKITAEERMSRLRDLFVRK